MGKAWIQLNDRFCDDYVKGVTTFLDFAMQVVDGSNRIRCPCRSCVNHLFFPLEVVRRHLFMKGMDKRYTIWELHGEANERFRVDPHDEDRNTTMDEIINEGVEEESSDEMDEMYEDLNGGNFMNDMTGEPSSYNEEQVDDIFTQTLRDSQLPLYPGCDTFSMLSFLINMLHIKNLTGLSNKGFDMYLQLFKRALPKGETLPKDYYEAKTIMRNLGLSYQRIHACKNGCVLFWKENEDKQECPTCGDSRWVERYGKRHNKVPKKVLLYFPLMPRLQRLFMCRKTAMHMRWHKDVRVPEEGMLRHPADSEVWKDFDNKHSWFAKEPRNVRLGLASDGFNPFGNMSNAYSIWPVVLMPYNLPPWMCMKEPYFMMSLLIPGPRSPGNDIDVFLRPLIEECKDLWSNGVPTYDASKGETFNMHAAILWTINDFPAYGNLSGWSTKGKMACPKCNKETMSDRLTFGRKQCYMHHRRFLPPSHSFRKNKRMFDNKIDNNSKPKNLSGDELLQQMRCIGNMAFGKDPITRKSRLKKNRPPEQLNWTKKSIFYELPYWRTLLLRHNLDVMHIEKNICDSLLWTIMNVKGKTKDNISARLDLQKIGIRHELHPRHEGARQTMPVACFTLSRKEVHLFCDFIRSVKLPDGYASNIARCVKDNECTFVGMKSHDSHVFLQRILPVGIRGFLRKDVSESIIQLGRFFQELCCRTLKLEVLESLEHDIVVLLCKFETIFPPSFFDIMEHLAIHLP
ncbi:uncharacterized protein LOC120003590 [Tripterygium wilfordii]|uniref:uncharacterized protein LOC120003590 n=1 Tax=Tripterygium wilfordii TaxID=458696 RepID=UPI0018F80770|nr:uncharacterized protein LOC120003590 [Tripterygium wilfordii]